MKWLRKLFGLREHLYYRPLDIETVVATINWLGSQLVPVGAHRDEFKNVDIARRALMVEHYVELLGVEVKQMRRGEHPSGAGLDSHRFNLVRNLNRELRDSAADAHQILVGAQVGPDNDDGQATVRLFESLFTDALGVIASMTTDPRIRQYEPKEQTAESPKDWEDDAETKG